MWEGVHGGTMVPTYVRAIFKKFIEIFLAVN